MISLSKSEIEEVFALAERLTGTCQESHYRREVLVTNVERRMSDLGIDTLQAYLDFVRLNPQESAELISRLTIHTTSWFRESPHYGILKQTLKIWSESPQKRPFCAWSAASSTGEEGYGMGLVLEAHRKLHPGFEYQLFFTDVDPKSLERAKKALYPKSELNRIPVEYHPYILLGSGKSSGWMTLHSEIRKRCVFRQNDMSNMPDEVFREKIDFILCRNVLIYFKPEVVKKIVAQLMGMVVSEGVICFGHSEALELTPKGFISIGNAGYKRSNSLDSRETRLNQKVVPLELVVETKKKILVIDDSAIVRKTIRKLLEMRKIEVTEAASGPLAREILKTQSFDLITLDLHMPEEDGLVWLEKERRNGLVTPILIVTDADPKESDEVIQALERGAQDYFLKSNFTKNSELLYEMIWELAAKKSKKNTTQMLLPDAIARPEIIVVGASTGGPEALCSLLREMPKDCPPILVVQHINAVFAKPFAERLARVAEIPLGLPEEGNLLENGKIYLAFGQYHIGVKKQGSSLRLTVNDGALICGHKPSVDFLFKSVATQRVKSLAILMTGMGRDGAEGISEIKKNTNGYCAIQDEESSIVYGMPGEAARLKAFHYQGNISELRSIVHLACGEFHFKELKHG